MIHLIDKDALVAKIEREKKYAQILGDDAINSSMQQFYDGMKEGCVELLSYVNALDAKEVDLIKEVANWKIDHQVYGMDETWYDFAEYFYKLGLKAQIGK